jgi:chromosome segregation ATPase
VCRTDIVYDEREARNQQFVKAGSAVGKTLDELFDKLDAVAERMEQGFREIDKRFQDVDRRFEQIDERFEQIDKRFEQVDKRFERIEERLDKHERRMISVEEMTASLIQMVGHTNARLEEVQADVHDLHAAFKQTNETVTFLDKKVWEQEKQLFLLRERLDKYLDDKNRS